jgi:hypothetical protein
LYDGCGVSAGLKGMESVVPGAKSQPQNSTQTIVKASSTPCNQSCVSLLKSVMTPPLQIDAPVFEDAPTVAAMPAVVAAMQPVVVPGTSAPAEPAWYMSPVAVIPFAAAAFIIGNVLMMIPWSAF